MIQFAKNYFENYEGGYKKRESHLTSIPAMLCNSFLLQHATSNIKEFIFVFPVQFLLFVLEKYLETGFIVHFFSLDVLIKLLVLIQKMYLFIVS